MKQKLTLLFILIILLLFSFAHFKENQDVSENMTSPKKSHWFILHRKSEKELLYYGISGDVNNSQLIKTFQVKPGNAENPTPLPRLLGRKYWLIIKKELTKDNPETAPYFLTLDIPTSGEWPYGPTPYLECKSPFTGETGQCEWGFPGYFGLHGVNGDLTKLSKENPGSLGCIRHKDTDISYLYNLLNPEKEEIRYYIKEL